MSTEDDSSAIEKVCSRCCIGIEPPLRPTAPPSAEPRRPIAGDLLAFEGVSLPVGVSEPGPGEGGVLPQLHLEPPRGLGSSWLVPSAAGAAAAEAVVAEGYAEGRNTEGRKLAATPQLSLLRRVGALLARLHSTSMQIPHQLFEGLIIR